MENHTDHQMDRETREREARAFELQESEARATETQERAAHASDSMEAVSIVGEPSGFWLGLEDYEGSPEFKKLAENEFLSSPLKSDDGTDGVARRDFLKLMGASLALATTGCVRRPAQKIIPYVRAPLGVTPGEANYYASSWFDGREGYGVVVKTLEGRPIKLEGNPLHPVNLGSLSARAHAEILALYDPDRLKGPRRNLVNKTRTNKETIDTTWNAADKKIVEQLKKGSIAVLTGHVASPSTRAILADFSAAYGSVRHYVWDPLGLDAVAEASRRSYGRAIVPRYRLNQAKMFVSIDADVLGTYISPAEFGKMIAAARKPGPEMMRMVAFEANVSLTGLNADDRIRIKPSQQLDVVLGLIYEIGVNLAKHPSVTNARNRTYLEGYKDVAARIGMEPAAFARIAAELWANRGRSVVMAGGLPTMTEEAVDLQAAVNVLNSILGNDGVTVDHAGGYEFVASADAGRPTQMASLIKDMADGKIQTLILHGVNPVYNYPDAEAFIAAAARVAMVLSTANWNDESASVADFVLPAGTSLEAWGDQEFKPGVYSIQQPTIRPLHDSRSFDESLHVWASLGPSAPGRLKAIGQWYDYVRHVWRAEVFPKAGGGQSFEDFWLATLQSGVVDASKGRGAGGARVLNGEALGIKPRAKQEGFELVLYPTVQLGDGQFANVSWLQELPDPVTKIVWDNYLMVSPDTAKAQDLREGDVVALSVGQRRMDVPVHVQPGLHDEVLALAVGYGRTHAGKVGNGVGVNAFKLALVGETGRAVCSGLKATIKKTGEWYELACVQGHHQLEGRNHVVEATLGDYLKNPRAGQHQHHVFSIWPQHQYNKHKWAMSIDLNACTGCSACVIACQSENNVPTVGKKYILQGREMHWIRIDRYYKGTPQNPQAVFEPMLCQHCETAPCETVCPVLATVHNDEGLNDMVYNRCVGTRYCANNCPYKVRRFNWFNYEKERQAPLHMALNPDVTVRARGVMEKCSFCVQRIRHGTNKARDEKRALKDGDIKTACQQTCPADAIVFGDLNDPGSVVAGLFKDPRTFAVLEELNTQPRVRYMSRIRNASRSMPNKLSENPADLIDAHQGSNAGGGHT